MQRELARERDRFRLLLEVNNAVVSHLNMDDVFASVSASLQKVIQHDGCSLMLYEPDTGPVPVPRAESVEERKLRRRRPGRPEREVAGLHRVLDARAGRVQRSRT